MQKLTRLGVYVRPRAEPMWAAAEAGAARSPLNLREGEVCTVEQGDDADIILALTGLAWPMAWLVTELFSCALK